MILGEQNFSNREALRAISRLACVQCKTGMDIIRSFNCHSWAYGIGALHEVIQQMPRTSSVRSSKAR